MHTTVSPAAAHGFVAFASPPPTTAEKSTNAGDNTKTIQRQRRKDIMTKRQKDKDNTKTETERQNDEKTER